MAGLSAKHDACALCLPVPHNRTSNNTHSGCEATRRALVLVLTGALYFPTRTGRLLLTYSGCRMPVPPRRPPVRDTTKKARQVKTARLWPPVVIDRVCSRYDKYRQGTLLRSYYPDQGSRLVYWAVLIRLVLCCGFLYDGM
jgi:hypothetical protein